jgi:hypothetical protein
MLSEIILENFKCFKRHTIPFRPVTVVVGRNNAGKSTIVEALRLVSLVVNRLEHLPVREVPRWLDIPRVNVGVAPSLENQDFNFSSIFHRYGDPPAKITARFETGLSVVIYIGGEDRVHAVIRDSHRSIVISKGQARRLGLPLVGILPQISPVSASETILLPNYVRRAMSSTLASLHFRNQVNLLYDEAFAEFKRISEATWPGLAIQELRGQGRRQGAELELMIRNDDFVAGVSWMGHGLQMWLQTMWFLARCNNFDTAILDEPDVYMHADLQRRLIRFLKGRHPQVIVATHSIEIMSEVDPENILVVDREKRQAQFTTDIPQVQQVVDQIGGVQNLQLARLWGSQRCLFVEGKDLGLLKQLQNRLFPKSGDPIDAIPNLSVGGWGGWSYAIGSSMLLRSAIGQDIRSYCIFDSDYHTPSQIAGRECQAREKEVNLHIWKRKELENYLLVPEAILRAVATVTRGTQPILTADLIGQKLFEFAGDLKDEVMDSFAAEFLVENRAGGPTQANRSAREHMALHWDTIAGRTSLVSGKVLLAKLSVWTQEHYGVTISPMRIARGMCRNEIAEEVVEILTAIEYNQPF